MKWFKEDKELSLAIIAFVVSCSSLVVSLYGLAIKLKLL